MNHPIPEQVIDFYQALFESIFSSTFRLEIKDRLKSNAVARQVQEAADAASQSLIRFLLNQKVSERETAEILEAFEKLPAQLTIENIANPNVTPEATVDDLLQRLPVPAPLQHTQNEANYRVALHSVVQVLMFVGPVMAEWKKLSFSRTFELPRRIVDRLNHISEQLDTLGRAGETAADESYELTYRDYLLQRFHRVEAGTVRMTTNLDVDLPELFVMPRVRTRLTSVKSSDALDAATLMNLTAARELFGGKLREPEEALSRNKQGTLTALEQIKACPRLAMIGVAGSGKSTCLEWLQLKLASAEEELVMHGEQAIPLLLRLRQLNPHDLPHGAALIEKATASKDRAALMPPGWIERQMRNGRIFFMLDGLDETEPGLRDQYVLPWLQNLCRTYPNCRYLVSSRPVGYPPDVLHRLNFVECDLLDFEKEEIAEYTCHWCTAIRLARNEPAEEARREGKADGERIETSFRSHPYIRNLARNPLMLSAICLVNYFEGGELPKDRALLYRLCVEGLLHHWDQRRGIHSEFALDEKLRACREVALAMQADDLAEYGIDKVEAIFVDILRDVDRAKKMLEHIRYRTGLLLERRQNIFGFAHLTFQEYLAARAVHEGNRLNVDDGRLANGHDDGRWSEVIALYCGLATTSAVRALLESLVAREDSRLLSSVLTEAYLSAGSDLSKDSQFRRKILERIAVAPHAPPAGNLNRFSFEEIAPLANECVGMVRSSLGVSEAHKWLREKPQALNWDRQCLKLKDWRKLSPNNLGELLHLVHAFGPEPVVAQVASDAAIYKQQGPSFPAWSEESCRNQAEIAMLGLAERERPIIGHSAALDSASLHCFRILSTEHVLVARHLNDAIHNLGRKIESLPCDPSSWPEFASLAKSLAKQWKSDELLNWAKKIKHNIGKRTPSSRPRPRTSQSRTASKGDRDN